MMCPFGTVESIKYIKRVYVINGVIMNYYVNYPEDLPPFPTLWRIKKHVRGQQFHVNGSMPVIVPSPRVTKIALKLTTKPFKVK